MPAETTNIQRQEKDLSLGDYRPGKKCFWVTFVQDVEASEVNNLCLELLLSPLIFLLHFPDHPEKGFRFQHF